VIRFFSNSKRSTALMALVQVKRYRGLLYSLVYRDIVTRFRQSTFSFLWLVLHPLCLLLVYSFVFQVVIRVRWDNSGFTNNNVPVGLVLFAGIAAYMLLAETLARCPTIISSNTSYVKKVVFPLAVLPIVVVASSLVFAAISFLLVTVIAAWIVKALSISVLAFIFPVLALSCMSLGLGWFTAALGVYFRDISQLMPFISTVLLFTAPICYPAGIVPEQLQYLMKINPLTVPVEAIRALLFGGDLNLYALIIYSIISIVVMLAGYVFFQRLRTGFADVM